MENIKCTHCQKFKPADITYFSENSKKKNGLHSWCRACESEYSRKYKKYKNFPPKMEGSKICTKCKLEKPYTDYPKDKNVSDGRTSWCKPCKYEFQKKYPWSKPKDGINSNIKYKSKFPDKWNEYLKVYHRKYRFDPKNKAKKNFTLIVRYAIQKGKYTAPTKCQDCGKKNCKMFMLIKDQQITILQNKITNENKNWKNIVEHISFVCQQCNINYRESKRK